MSRGARAGSLGPALIVLLALAWALFLGQRHVEGAFDPVDLLEEPLTDLRTRIAGPAAPPAEVVIVAIDDAAVTAEGGYPLGRHRFAALLDAIRAAGARTIAIDLLFLDPEDPAADAALARALAQGPAVVAAAGQFAPGDPDVAAAPRLSAMLPPLPIFAAAAETGLANVATNGAGTPRHLPLIFAGDAGPLPAFALRAAALHRSAEPILSADGIEIAGLSIPLDLRWHLPLRFYGPAGSIRTIGATAFLSGSPPPPRLDGAIAVVGVTATAVGDTFGTPFDAVTPGVEVQATGIAELLGGPRLDRSMAIRWLDAALAAVLATGGTLLVLRRPLSQSLPAAAFGLLLVLAGNAAAFSAGLWMSAALPIAAAVPPWALAAFYRAIDERRRARAMETAERALSRFQPMALAGRIANDPAFLRQPVEEVAAVLFVDMVGFSTRSELIGAGRTQDLLKGFHTLVVDIVEAEGGLVLNFMGDGAMIVFGAFDIAPNPAGRAFRAARTLSVRTLDWLEREAGDGRGLGIRLGLHLGPVVLSRLGHEHHQQVGISGNTVNLASRLMEVAKEHGATMAVSRAVLDALDPGEAIRPDLLRDVPIRGLRESVVVGLWMKPPD